MLTSLLCVTTAMAEDYYVNTDSKLREAIANNYVDITLTADIDLSNSTLEITSNRNVTINLNNHTLDRKLTQCGENGGQVFTVRNGSTLNLNGGTVKGGWGGDDGGIVKAYGGNYAAGIGGGDSRHGADLTIKSSIVDKQKSISII